MANLNTLFDFSKWEKRKPIEQQQFETANKQLSLDFIDYVTTSFQKLHTIVLRSIEPIDQDKNLCAIVMSGFLAGFFKRNYVMLCGKATKQRFRLFSSNTCIYIKKLDERTKLPSNIPTDESLKIHHQLTDTMKDVDCNIFLGYTVTESWSMITGVYAVCIEGEKVLWISNLSDLDQRSNTPIIPMPPMPIAPKVKEGAKRRKTKNE